MLGRIGRGHQRGSGGGPSLYGLADFGAQNYTGATVIASNGTKGNFTPNSTLWTSYSITMHSQSSGDTLAKPRSLEGGTAFIDKWVA